MRNETGPQEVVSPQWFPTHEIDTVVFHGDPTRIYRARRKDSGMPVMLKTLRDERAAREAAALLTHEYEMARRINVPGVIRMFSLDRHNNMPVIELEDFGGESLDNIARQRRLPLEELLRIAVQLADGVAELHAANIIHKDINPSNVVYNSETGVAKIIDFGISTHLTREQAALTHAERFEGSLPYISPEQTGRMNRSIDYRTDLYSFGVTLYELLTGQPLFIVSEPIEWFHCHIAKQPVPPAQVDPDIPKPVSDIVMKLLAKTAENRYQSAQGLRADLQHCLEALHRQAVVEPFDLARHDVSERFQIPQRLYGRDDEVARLLSSFEQVGRGSCKMVLVSGYSGIGKTCLINEIYKPITEARGHFVSGKYDQLHRNVPYFALAGALRDLIRQLLTLPETVLAQWGQKILAAVGANGQLMIDVIHELELVIGPQPEIPEVPPVEAEQRFHRTFQRFIQVFCAPEHPLAIFLDDLQWTDSASMRLLNVLSSSESNANHLLLIGAYRDNEIQPGHPVAHWLKELPERNMNLEQIQLRPLSHEHLTDLLVDTLGAQRQQVETLAQIVENKTAGNPFFTEEFLKALHQGGLIEFSHAQRRWTWDIEKIRDQQMTDNVVDLMTIKLQRLKPETLELLQLGACIGFRFGLKELAVVSEQPPAVAAAKLQQGIDEGLIAPVGDVYLMLELASISDLPEITIAFAFAHDRIHQAAYLLLDNDQRCRIHLKIGRLLQDHLPPSRQDELLFDITNHLNLGSTLITEADDRKALCRLNLLAGKRAKNANAYQPAFDHFQVALLLLDAGAWQDDYALALALFTEASEAAYLTGDYARMDELLTEGLASAHSLLDRVKLYMVQLSACMARGRLLEAIDIARPVLAKLGHHYPARPNPLHILMKLFQVKRRMRRLSIDDLRQLPEMTDPNHVAAMRIGGRIGGAAMFAQPNLLPLMVLTGVIISLDHGFAPETLTSYPTYGMILAESLGRVDRGDAYGKLALELVDKYQVKTIRGRVKHLYHALVRHWKEPARNSLAPLHEAYLDCLEYGDFEYAAHALVVRLGMSFEVGTDLQQLSDEVREWLSAVKPLNQGPRVLYINSVLQKIECLRGNSADPARLDGQYYDIDQMMPQHEKSGDTSLVLIDRSNQMRLYYLFGRYQEALQMAGPRAQYSVSGVQGMYFIVPFLFYDALIRLANVSDCGKRLRNRLMRLANRNYKILKRYAKNNPSNCLNKVCLIEGEMLRIAGRDFDAHKKFDSAARLAREQDFIHEEALAHELCGTMHVKAGRLPLGEPYLARARDLYQHWGAAAKVKDLERRYPQIISRSKPVSSTTTSWGAPHVTMDIGSLIKGLKAIAEETAHSRMVETIIETSMEFAGAQHGMLILRNPGGVLCLEAEASVDGGNTRILQSIPVTQAHLSQAVVNYVSRTRSSVVVHDAQQANEQIPGLNQDTYIREQGTRSVLCLPIMSGRQEKTDLIGMLYLENNRAGGVFTQERFDTLEIICLAAAGRLELSRKAVIDGLTDLYNHDYLQNILHQEFASAKRHGHDLALIMIDIDHFKKFNDTWGHQAGDLVLKEVARLIKSSCRSGDTVARYGGEEIAVILPMTGSGKAEMVAERIRQAVEKHRIALHKEYLSVTISLGLAMLNAGIADKDTLIRCADKALYASKAQGRNRLTVD